MIIELWVEEIMRERMVGRFGTGRVETKRRLHEARRQHSQEPNRKILDLPLYQSDV